MGNQTYCTKFKLNKLYKHFSYKPILYIKFLKANLSWVDYEDKNQTCEISKRCGKGGFFPFDFDGVVKGAAKCFYAYIGMNKLKKLLFICKFNQIFF